jgi:hypothetical protein
MATFCQKLKKLVEDDLAKMMGRPVITKKLWQWMVVDFFLIQLLIGPCNVLIWRGGWELYNHVLGINLYNGIILFFLGLFLSIPLIIYSYDISVFADEILINDGPSSFRYIYVTRFYSIITFLVMLLFWKGWFDIWHNFPYHISNLTHWHLSLSCLVLGSLILMYIGCFKTAAMSPPMGLWLDTATHYVHVDQFYDVKDTLQKTWRFRLVNAILTLIMEVISLMTYYGAYSLAEDLFHEKIVEMFGATSIQASAFILAWAFLFSALGYVGSILYLYIHYECKSNYCNETLKSMCYDTILLVSVIATALHFHAWWEVLDVIKIGVFGGDAEAYPELIFISLGFGVMILTGVGSGNHYGVSWEILKEEDGMLLPFIYLTYIRRERKPNNKHEDMVVDVMVDYIEDYMATE